MALTLLWRSASICTRAALPRRSIASTLLSRGARQSGAPRIVIGLTAAAAAASAIGAYAYTRSVSEAVLNTNESAHEELELANTEVAKVLHFLPGPRELMSDTSRWLVARLAAVCWWYSARILRTLQLTALFVPVALCAPLLVVQSPHADSIVYNQLLRSMEWSGATLCKLGQWASHREDMLPVELCHVLRRLRSDAPSHSAEFTRRSIEEDFCAQGREWPFSSFDAVPIASGTVGQVHRATVRESGQVVAVKVLHPNVEEQLDMDIGILFGAARIISRLPYMSWARIPVGVQEFSAILRQQADLTIEADNLRRFEDFFHARDLAVVFPRPIDGLVSRRVLTMSWENGCGLGEFIDKASAPAKARMAALGFDVFMSMLIMDNFVHVDSHVGNSMVQPSVWRHEEMRKSVARKNGADMKGSSFNFAAIASEFTLAAAANLPPSVDPSIKPVVGAIAASVASMGEAVVNHGSISRASPGESLVCIDAGMVASLSKAGRAHLISMLIDIVKADGEHAARMCVHLSRNGCPGGASGERAFHANCKALFDREVSQRRAAGHAVNVHCLLQGIMNAVRDAHMELDSEFATIMVAMETQESVARALQPDIDLVAKVVPFLFKHPSAALKFWINDRLPDAAR